MDFQFIIIAALCGLIIYVTVASLYDDHLRNNFHRNTQVTTYYADRIRDNSDDSRRNPVTFE